MTRLSSRIAQAQRKNMPEPGIDRRTLQRADGYTFISGACELCDFGILLEDFL